MPRFDKDQQMVPNRPSLYYPQSALVANQRNLIAVQFSPITLQVLLRLAQAAEGLASAISQVNMPELVTEIRRISNHFDPPPSDVIGTDYIAGKLGCTKVWVAELVRSGEIPAGCIVSGTGNGKPWKFHRSKRDRWLRDR